MAEPDLARLQIAIWLARQLVGSTLEIASTIVGASGGALDGEPLIVPTPAEVPLEFPRAVLRSADNDLQVQLWGSRVDVVLEVPPERLGETNLSEAMRRQAALAQRLWERLEAVHGATGTRIGVVTTLVGEMPDPVGFISGRFMAQSKGEAPQELQLHALACITWNTCRVNRWVRAIAGPLVFPDGRSLDAVRLEVDVNTQADADHTVSASSIGEFAAYAEQVVGTVSAAALGDGPVEERVF